MQINIVITGLEISWEKSKLHFYNNKQHIKMPFLKKKNNIISNKKTKPSKNNLLVYFAFFFN